MSVTDLLDSAQFVVNERGKRTAAILDIETWQKLVQWAARQESANAAPVEIAPPPIEKLEQAWGDFWPEDESVDDFLASTRQWRDEDPSLHWELP